MRVFRTTYKDKAGRTREAAKWYVEFRNFDESVRRVPAFTDKKQSEECGRKIEKLVACRANGESPDAAVMRWLESLPSRIRDKLAGIALVSARTLASGKPLATHLDDFKAALLAKGTSERHAQQTVTRARALFDGCGFRFWSEVSAARVQTHLATLLEDTADDEGLSIQTVNFYLQAVKQFSKWMVRDGRASQSPLEHLQGRNVQTDRRHDRRALSVDELRRLLSATQDGPERFGMGGADRALLYRLAVESGFRAKELRSMSRASFNFAAERATVTVRAGFSKRRRQDVLPLRADTADKLQAHLANKLPEAPAFALPRADQMADMMRADLAASRAAWLTEAATDDERAKREQTSFLAYRDAAGHVADFHSLRHTFISNLARSGVHPKLAQSLARHSDINLTMSRYTHTTQGEQSEALDALPDLSPMAPMHERATGTDGRQTADKNLASCLARKGTPASNSVQRDAVSGHRRATSPTMQNTRENTTEPEETTASDVVRLAGFEPATYGLGNRCSIP
jgi:integrase